MANMEEVKRRIYAVGPNEVIELLTTFRVNIGAKGSDGYLAEEAKRIKLYDNAYQSATAQREDSLRINRSIYELVLLTKDNRKWWLLDPTDACKIFWRIDRFLQAERVSLFGGVDKRKIPDYKVLGEIAERMLGVMDHYTRGMSKDTFTIERPIERTPEERELDAFIGNFAYVSGEGTTEIKTEEVARYHNPFAKELEGMGIDIHDIFRI